MQNYFNAYTKYWIKFFYIDSHKITQNDWTAITRTCTHKCAAYKSYIKRNLNNNSDFAQRIHRVSATHRFSACVYNNNNRKASPYNDNLHKVTRTNFLQYNTRTLSRVFYMYTHIRSVNIIFLSLPRWKTNPHTRCGARTTTTRHARTFSI